MLNLFIINLRSYAEADHQQPFSGSHVSLDDGDTCLHQCKVLRLGLGTHLFLHERQAVAIARAVYFGAKVLILDEPTSALGVRQSGIVLKYVLAAKERGVSVVFITHNPHHAYLVGDYFYLLNRGQLANEYERSKVELDELTKAMAGGAELDALTKEIQQVRADV